jgi:hypothetical protein
MTQIRALLFVRAGQPLSVSDIGTAPEMRLGAASPLLNRLGRLVAWGTWPQVLRLLDGRPFRAADGNPLASLFTRLTKNDLASLPPADGSPQEVGIGAARLIVHPSYTAFRASAR